MVVVYEIVFVGVCLYVCVYVCMYMRTYVGMYVRTYVCRYVHMYVCMYCVRMYVCMYNNINSQLDATIINLLLISISSTCFGR